MLTWIENAIAAVWWWWREFTNYRAVFAWYINFATATLAKLCFSRIVWASIGTIGRTIAIAVEILRITTTSTWLCFVRIIRATICAICRTIAIAIALGDAATTIARLYFRRILWTTILTIDAAIAIAVGITGLTRRWWFWFFTDGFLVVELRDVSLLLN